MEIITCLIIICTFIICFYELTHKNKFDISKTEKSTKAFHDIQNLIKNKFGGLVHETNNNTIVEIVYDIHDKVFRPVTYYHKQYMTSAIKFKNKNYALDFLNDEKNIRLLKDFFYDLIFYF